MNDAKELLVSILIYTSLVYELSVNGVILVQYTKNCEC